MNYLIKDLAKLSGLAPARIRKWQERYKLFQPTQASNGYYYYTNDDLFVIKTIQRELIAGKKLSHIVSLGRDQLLPALESNLDRISDPVQRWVAERNYDELRNYFEAERAQKTLAEWIRHTLKPAIVTVGIGWEEGVLSISDEHAFTAWFREYFSGVNEAKRPEEPTWLVAVYQNDQHELGALLHYALLIDKGYAAQYIGCVPHDELVKEIASNVSYETISISFVNPIKKKIVRNYRKTLRRRFPKVRFRFGGFGYRHQL